MNDLRVWLSAKLKSLASLVAPKKNLFEITFTKKTKAKRTDYRPHGKVTRGKRSVYVPLERVEPGEVYFYKVRGKWKARTAPVALRDIGTKVNLPKRTKMAPVILRFPQTTVLTPA